MFALEIDFHDGISPPETILVRRSNAIVGSSELAHVVVEGAASSFCELRLIRGLGREFSCFPVRRPGHSVATPPFLEGTYPGEAELKLGDLGLHVTSLDIDLCLLPDEFPDRAAVRILRRALTAQSPVFPAVAVLGAKPMYISFPSDGPLLIGRSRRCGLRLDAPDVSSEHARIGVEEERCWVEDLGSTNGTYVGEERISGRRYLQNGEIVSIGSEFSVAPVLLGEDVVRLNSETTRYPDTGLLKSYPCIVTNSESVRPTHLPLKPHVKITIGRDPANDIWINLPHISRSHVELLWSGEELVRVVDHSSNGTLVDGERLVSDKPVDLEGRLKVLDLCSGVLLAVCYSEDDENCFLSGQNQGENISIDENTRDIFDSRVDSTEHQNVRQVLEKAAGISGADPDQVTQKTGVSVFEKLAQRQSIQAQTFPDSASEFSDRVQGTDFHNPAGNNRVGDSPQAESDFDEGLSEFERYQLSRQQAPEEAEFDRDYDLLAEAEFEEDFLESSQFGGLTRLAMVGLIVVLVIVILFLIMNVFARNFL